MNVDIKSKLYLAEDEVGNEDRHFNGFVKGHAVVVVFPNGSEEVGIFTPNAVNVALNRGIENPEDIPRKKSLFSKFFGG